MISPPDFPHSAQSIGAYQLIEEIGAGGMGTVWRARRADGLMEREVAIKLISLGMRTMTMRERFARERQILATLNHPNIARLYEAGVTEAAQPYLVLELVEGEPIDAYCDARKLSVAARLRLFQQVLAAVAHAHQHLVVHRDLKPSNILVTADGAVKLLDFGISKLLRDQQEAEDQMSAGLTRDVGRILTPQYASPEQLTGQSVTTASDIYSAGVLLFRLLAGQLPYQVTGDNPAALARAIVDTEPISASVALKTPSRLRTALTGATKLPTAQVSGTDKGIEALDSAADTLKIRAEHRGTNPQRLRAAFIGDIDNILRKALRKDPFERYASAGEFADDLRAYLELRPVRAQPDSWRYRTLKFAQRNRGAVAAAVLTTVAVLSGATLTTWQAVEANKQAALARAEASKAQAIRDYLLGIFRAVGRDATDFPKRGETTARELLDHSSQRINAQFHGQPELRAYLHETVSKLYFDLDLTPQALAVAEQWAQAARTGGEGETRDYVGALIQKGVVLTRMGRAADARATLEEARSKLNANAPDEDWARLHLALALMSTEEFRHADAAAAIAQVKRVGKLSVQSAAELDYVEGQARFRAGDQIEGERLLRRASDAMRQIYGESSARTSDVLWRLGIVHTYRNDWPAARRTLDAALRTIERSSGASHRDTIVVKRELANSLVREGELETAFRLMDEVLAGARERASADKNFGLLASVLQSWGRVRMFAGDHVAAHRAFGEALQLTVDAKLGPVFEGFVKFDLAQSTFALRELPAAAQLARAAIEIYAVSQGADALVTRNAKLILSEVVRPTQPAVAEAWRQVGLHTPTTQLVFPSTLVRHHLHFSLDETSTASKTARADALDVVFREATNALGNGEARFREAQAKVVRVLVIESSAANCRDIVEAVALVNAYQVPDSPWRSRARQAASACEKTTSAAGRLRVQG